MRLKERHRTGQADIFRSRLDQIVDMKHPLALLPGKIDWGFLEAQFGAVYTDRPGRPPLPTRLMAGLAILKSMHDLSDEALCDRWVENPYFQLFCGEEFGETKSEFAFGCITGSFGDVGDSHSIAFDWGGADEMDEAHGDGWVELQADGSLTGEITFRNGDESGFIASRWESSLTAC